MGKLFLGTDHRPPRQSAVVSGILYCRPFQAHPSHCALPLPSQMDPVQKAVISHTFGVPSPLKKKLFISCNICHLRFNSAVRGSSGNGLGRGLGRKRAGDWASGRNGVAEGLWSGFPVPGCKKRCSWSFTQPLLPSLQIPLPLPSLVPLGLHFPPLCLSRVFWILLQERRLPFATLYARGHPISSWFGPEFVKAPESSQNMFMPIILIGSDDTSVRWIEALLSSPLVRGGN